MSRKTLLGWKFNNNELATFKSGGDIQHLCVARGINETTYFSFRYSSKTQRNFSAGALASRVKLARWERDVAAVLRCLEVAFANMLMSFFPSLCLLGSTCGMK